MELPTNITSTNLADGDVAIRYLREQEAIRRARSKRRWIAAGAILAGMFVLMVGCGIAVGAAASGGSTATASAAPTAATEVPTDSGLREETRIVPVPPAAVSAPAIEAPVTPAPSTEPPRTWITNGMWHVGDEVEAGTYRTTGKADATTYKCMITVEQDTQMIDYVSVDDGPARVTVTAGQTVTVEGCAPLTKVG